jgi:hypothetical protein
MRVNVTKPEEVNSYYNIDKVYFSSTKGEVPIDVTTEDFGETVGKILILNLAFISEIEIIDEEEEEE